jgi:hypothetical protein
MARITKMKLTLLPLFASLVLAGSASAQQDVAPVCTLAKKIETREVKYRKNIEDLTAAELAAYEHAIKMMKLKSQHNVFDRTGFLWQAWVHNCSKVDVLDGRYAPLSEAGLTKLLGNQKVDSCNINKFLDMSAAPATHPEQPGECEHQKNTFLQWHRAQLYYYEKALQNADPDGVHGPSTKNVALPYWNFTRKPSGVRYPKAFENAASPLFDTTRVAKALPSSLATASPYVVAYQIYYLDWAAFGGDESGRNGGGALETKIHNRMHASYIDGNMSDNTTAALDPLFYAFHNFLDYVFEAWLVEHGPEKLTGSNSELFMRAEQDDGLPKPIGWSAGKATRMRTDSGSYAPNMGAAGIYFDTVKQGYGFQPTFGGEFIRRQDIQDLIDGHQQAGFVFGDQQSLFSALLNKGNADTAAKPQVKKTADYMIPGRLVDRPQKARLCFKRLTHSDSYSFQADVYLYPANVAENIGDRDFRSRYLVTNTAHWAVSHGDGVHTTMLVIGDDISPIINSLVPTRGGSNWRITVAISDSDIKPARINAGDFTAPWVQIGKDANPIVLCDQGGGK